MSDYRRKCVVSFLVWSSHGLVFGLFDVPDIYFSFVVAARLGSTEDQYMVCRLRSH